jgi:Ni,Fe-hydrogenase I cytochrome b subunit
MRTSILLILLLFIAFGGFAQQDSVQTIVISKVKAKLFRGTDSETLNWYFYIDEAGYSYLANL